MPRYQVLCEATARSALVVEADTPEAAYAAAAAIMQSPEPPPLPDVCGPCGLGAGSAAPFLEIGDYELADREYAVVDTHPVAWPLTPRPAPAAPRSTRKDGP